jgi:sugar phosphate isomerase/epimerase
MVAHGFAGVDLLGDLEIASRLGATALEILPDWKTLPDPVALGRMVDDAGFRIHSAHGCWGPQSISAARVDLGSNDAGTRRKSVDDLHRCIDWLAEARGTCLVVHPGGLSTPEDESARRDGLARSLLELAEHASGTGVVVCVENMPRGVFPGSRMADLFNLLAEIGRADLALALDTGHAHLTSTAHEETLAAGPLLRTTHVHDNLGRQDTHLPPGLGTIDWQKWASALNAVDYLGPIVLECIKHLRTFPESLSDELLGCLDRLRTIGPRDRPAP